MRVRDPDLDDPFEEAIDEALSSLPAEFRRAISNVAILVEDEPPGRASAARPVLRCAAAIERMGPFVGPRNVAR